MSELNESAPKSAESETNPGGATNTNEQFVPPERPPSNIPTPASSVTGIPVSKLKAPTSFGSSTGSISKIGRLCSHATPKAGPPPRDTDSMSRESDDNLSSINSTYTDMYQETVRRFTRSSLTPDMDRKSPSRYSMKSTTPSSQKSSDYDRGASYDFYLEATGRRRSSDHGAILTSNTEQFIIGQRVWVGGIRPGQIAFIGETHFAPGDWAGIVLDEANGKNDGCVAGKRYFQCEPKRGIFSRLTRLTLVPMSGAHTPTSPISKYSPDRSRTVSPTASVRSSFLRSPGKDRPQVGDRVIVSSGFGSRPGILRYLGETKFASGNWCGVELDEPTGKNDGAVDGIRYFDCQAKYGVFVPIAKVSLSPSSKKSRLSRTGSRESLTSIGTMNSIVTTNTSRMRMSAQRKSLVKPNSVSPPKAQFSMQDMLRERQNQIEQLMIERDLDRHEAQSQGLQFQKRIDELEEKVKKLEKTLGKERKKNEDLQVSVDEATFCGDELDAQSQVYKERIQDLERKIQILTNASDGVDHAVAINAATEAANEEIQQLRSKLENQTKAHQAKLLEMREAEKRFRADMEDLQKQVEDVNESGQKMQQNLKDELATVKSTLGTTENELKTRNTEFNNLNDQLLKLNAELSVQRAESATLDELLKSQQLDSTEGKRIIEDKSLEANKLKDEIIALRKRSETTENQLKEVTETLRSLDEKRLKLEKELEEEKLKGVDKESKQQELENVVGELRKKLEESSNESDNLNADLKKLHEANELLKSEEEIAKRKMHELQEALEEVNKNLVVAEESKTDVEMKMKDFENLMLLKTKESEDLKAQIQTYEEKTRLLQSESSSTIQDTSAKIDGLNAQIKELQNNLTQREELLKSLHTEADSQKAVLAEKLNELKSTTAALENMDKLNEQLQLELDVVRGRTKELDESLKQNETKCAAQELELGDLTRKVETLQHKCETLASRNESLEKDLQSTRTKGGELQTELQRLNAELDGKQKLYADLESQSNENRLKLESQLSESQQKLSNITKDFEVQLQQLQQAKEEIAQQKSTITVLEEKTVKQELALSDAARQQQNTQSKADALAAQNEALQKDLTTLRTTSTDSNVELLKLTEDVSKRQKAYEELFDKTNSERAALETELQMRQQRLDALCSQIETLTLELKSTAEESFKRCETLKQAEEKLGKQELELGDLTRKLDAQGTKITSLEAENSSLQTELTTQRAASKDSNVELLKLNEEAAAKHKALQALIDESHTLRLSLENKLQEQEQRLKASQCETETLKNELEKITAEKSAQALEFESLKATLQQNVKDQLESLKATESSERTKLLAELERQTEVATSSKHTLEEAITRLEKQIENLQTELQNTQTNAKTKQTELLKTIEELRNENSKLISKLDQVHADHTTASTKSNEETILLQQNIESLSKSLKDKEESLQQLQGETMQAKLAEANSNSDLSQIQTELKTLRDALESTKSELDHKTKLTESDKRRIEELESLLEAFKKSNAQITATNAKLSESLQVAETEKNEISQIFELFEMESDQTSTELIEKLAFMKQELEFAQNKASSMDAALQSSREKSAKTLQEAQNALAALQENAMEHTSKLSGLEQERDVAVRNGQAIEQEYRNVQNTLARYKTEKEREVLELRKRIDALKAVPNIVSTASSGSMIGGGDDQVLGTNGGDGSSQIDFLHSIIADMQQKNDTLKAKIQALEAIPTDFTQPKAFELLTKRKPAPRLFCDICDEFDKHETEDCPIQASDDRDLSPPPFDGEKKERKVPPPRKYCESCEVFGHEAGECDAEESY